MALWLIRHWFSLLSDPRGITGGLEGTVGSACEEFEDKEKDILG